MNSLSMAAVVLREQNSEDEPFLFRLYESTRREELDQAGLPESYRAFFLRQQFEAMTSGYRSRFAGACWQVIELEGRPAGRVIVYETAAEMRVVDLSLLDEFRGRGIGSEVMTTLQSIASARGKPVRLRAFLGSRAERWYRRLGFLPLEEDGLRVHLEWTGSSPESAS